MKRKDIDKEISLRSEKVRNIVGQIPPSIVRMGISVISTIILILLFLAYIFPYKEYEIVQSELYCRPAYQITEMPDNGTIHFCVSNDKVHKNQKVGYIQNVVDSIIDLYSYLDGKIVLNCTDGDYLEQNDIIFSIIPDSISQILGISYIKIDRIDKIKVNQKVIFSSINNDKTFIGVVSKIYPIEISDGITQISTRKVEMNFSNDFFLNKKENLFQ